MQTMISCAKDMAERDDVRALYGCSALDMAAWPAGTPIFWDEAVAAAEEMAELPAEAIAGLMKCNGKLAELNKERFARFGLPFSALKASGMVMQAAVTYSGVAFKHLLAGNLTQEEKVRVHDHLFIMSFLYGLLRPMDLILPYRMEGAVKLEVHDGKTMFDWWKPRLTGLLIDAVKADDGILLWCSTEEMKRMVDWKRVISEVRVIEPDFLVSKDGKLKSMSVYAKMCRGAMARQCASGSLAQEELEQFQYQGFRFSAAGKAADGHEVLTFIAEQ